MENKFKLKRLLTLLLIEVSMSYKYFLFSLLVPLLINFLTSLDELVSVNSMLYNSLAMYKAFIIGGVVFTSYSFSQMHKKSENHFWFMFPASSLEKFLSKLLSSLVYYYFVFTIGFLVLMLISQLFFLRRDDFAFLFSNEFFIEVFIPDAIYFLKYYLILNSIFLLGAVVFKRRFALYTTFSTIIFVVLLLILLVSFVKFGLDLGILQKHKSFIDFSIRLFNGDTLILKGLNNTSFDFKWKIINAFFSYIKSSFFIIFPLIMYLISYNIMKCKQVSHGI